ncbi:MAG: phenylalanine--tRNA ligase subunit beta [Patescibacteria group bacterium]|nr:phenylalanine--tRNA ligase subunit beta [Patescibacteria group bacterium]
MNILASYNWIKEFVSVKAAPDEVARRVSLSGPGFERSFPQSPPFENMVVGRIEEIKSHPNADKLRIAVTDIGEKKLDIVCGGSNLSEGMKVVVALAGAMVRWHGEGDLVELQPAEVRGVKSEAMICAASEIGLGEAFPHSANEIMDLSWCKVKPGTRLAKALDLDDTVFDIEITTNRPDSFSMVGIAREIAAIMGVDFTWKETVTPSMPKSTDPLPFGVKVEEPKLCTRYQAVVMDGIEIGPSPWWLKNRLHMAGIRPINNVVDITNYVLLEIGQPMHAFDYDKLKGAAIVVRRAKDGEEIALLDDSTQKLDKERLIIADKERAIAIAGVMGGEDTGVTEKTTRIVFESATFDPVSVRRTWRSLNIQTDSSLRFEKGLPEDLTQAALARAVELCQKVACGKVASKVYDERSVRPKKIRFAFRPERAEALIGIKIPASRMVKILKSLGFGVTKKPTIKRGKAFYDVEVPYWRARDIESERDFAEEVARVYGYANLPSVLPDGVLPVRMVDPVLMAEDDAKRFFCSAGFMEMVNYSFISRQMLERAKFDPGICVKLENPLTGDFEFMRPSLLPGMLSVVSENEGLFPQGDVFEVSNIYIANEGAELPEERASLLLASYGPQGDDTLFRRVKGALDAYFGHASRSVDYSRVSPNAGLWHPGRAVDIYIGDTAIGTMGELHPAVVESFGIDVRICAAEFDLTVFVKSEAESRSYEPIPQFPPVRRDLAFVVAEDVEFAKVEEVLHGSSELIHDVTLFDVYRDDRIGAGMKSFAAHLSFQHSECTLKAEEVDKEIEKIMGSLEKDFGAKVRG